MSIEEIHKKAKTPHACGGDEVHIQDNDFGGGEYMLAEELFGLVQLLQLVPNFDYVRAFKDVFLMGDELDVNHEPTQAFEEFAEEVTTFTSRESEENALEDRFVDMFEISDHLYPFINWREVREYMLQDLERAEINGVTYLWKSY